jgi:acetate kinase
MMSDAVLILNAGSSSTKFGLFDISETEPRLLCKGLLDEHETKPGLSVTDAAGNHLFEKRRAPTDHNGEALLADILNWSNDYLTGGTLVAIGHRVVHGGRDFDGPVEVTDETLEAMAALTPLAPLHQPRCLSPMRAFKSLRPGLTQIACFDTAFHHGLTPPVSRFAIPRRSPVAWAKSRRSWQASARLRRISATAPACVLCAMAKASIQPWVSRLSTD